MLRDHADDADATSHRLTAFLREHLEGLKVRVCTLVCVFKSVYTCVYLRVCSLVCVLERVFVTSSCIIPSLSYRLSMQAALVRRVTFMIWHKEVKGDKEEVFQAPAIYTFR